MLLSGAALANDGIVFLAESVELVEDKKTNVAMREEEIIITLYRDYYEVDVSLKFYNDGPDEKLLVGFPVIVSGSGFNEKEAEKARKAILKSYVNGKLLSPAEYTIKEEYDRDTIYYSINDRSIRLAGYTKWLLREIVFKSKSYTESRVVYKMPYSTNYGPTYAGYRYGTGRSWKGPIGKMAVVVNHGDDLIAGVVEDGWANADEEKLKYTQFIWEANGRYRYIFENVNPRTKNDYIRISIAENDMQKYYNQFECQEYGLFSCRFDCWYECEGEEGRDWFPGSWHWHKALIYKDPSDIRLFTKNQVRLFINFFFAAHGYDFKNPQYKNYFQKLKYVGHNTAPYKVNPSFSEKDFNDIERKNIDYLLKLEKMIPNKTGEEAQK
jgi:hypothetical protein